LRECNAIHAILDHHSFRQHQKQNSGLPSARFLGQNYIYMISIVKQRLIELCNGSSFPLFVEKWGATFVEIILSSSGL
jgi:hypothetical protein